MKRWLIALVLMVCSSTARAGEPWNPIMGLYLVPFAPIAPVPNGGCGLGVSGLMVNHLTFDRGPWGEIQFNAEEWRLEFGVRHSFARFAGVGSLEWGATLPVRLIWGGILDAPLDAFHRFLGVGFNPPGQENQVLILTQFGGVQRRLDQTAGGLGDPVFRVGGTLEPVLLGLPQGSGFLYGSLAVKAPLGDPSVFLGAGLWVIGGNIGWSSSDWGVQGLLSVPVQTAAVLGNVWLRPSVGVLGWFRTNFEFLPDWLRDLRVETTITSSPLPNAGLFSSPAISLRFVFYGFGFTEDITPGQPDVVLEASAEIPCGLLVNLGAP